MLRLWLWLWLWLSHLLLLCWFSSLVARDFRHRGICQVGQLRRLALLDHVDHLHQLFLADQALQEVNV